MPKMFSRTSCIGNLTVSNLPTSTNNNQITRSMRLSQLTRTSRYSVNRTIANTFAPTDLLLSSTNVPLNMPIGTEIGVITSNNVNSFAFTYSVDDNVNFYIQEDKLYTNTIFTDATLSYTINISSSDGTVSFNKQFTLKF
jgi:hypothetical protein